MILFDAANGRPLAIMDSISITALRTAAASAVAAKYLARPECNTMLICGCGGQAASQLEALRRVRKPRRVFAYDREEGRARAFAARFDGVVGESLEETVRSSDIVVTCTTAERYFIAREMVRPGTFIAAVGADNERKQEIDPRLLADAKVAHGSHRAGCADRRSAPCDRDRHNFRRRRACGTWRGDRWRQARTRAGRRDHRVRFHRHRLADVAAAIAVYERALKDQTEMKGTLLRFALAGATSVSATTEGFDAATRGSLPAGWECGVTGARRAGQSRPTQPHPARRKYCSKAAPVPSPACARTASLADGYVEVKFKPMRGREDQAGGVVWRWKDANNYYVARANALENNVSLYHAEWPPQHAQVRRRAGAA